MKTKHSRRENILSKVLRKQEWQLDKLSAELTLSETRFQQSLDDEQQLSEDLNNHQNLLKQMLNDNTGIDLGSFTDVQRFISQQEQVLAERTQHRHQYEAELMSLQSAYAEISLLSKGYENARDISVQALAQHAETAEQVSNLELWIQNNPQGNIRRDR
ncbi:MAG: hypothetical protein JXR18_12430 [Neptuniibacter sp.]